MERSRSWEWKSALQELNGLCRPRCGAVQGAAVLPAPATGRSRVGVCKQENKVCVQKVYPVHSDLGRFCLLNFEYIICEGKKKVCPYL